jgi:hypothetical protein
MFLETVRNEFRFLVEQRGFREVPAPPDRVRYASDSVIIEVMNTGRGEIDLIVDENPPSYRFQYYLFLRLFHPSVAKTLGDGIVDSDEELKVQIVRLADALKRHGDAILRHDHDVFSRLHTVTWADLGNI